MKKLIALLLALMMVFSLVACGEDAADDADVGDDAAVSDDVGTDDTDAEGTGITDNNGEEVTADTIAALTEAYNNIAVTYNDLATAANDNGWMADEQTAAEFEALSNTLGFVGAGLTEDLTMLDGTDFVALIDMLENELPAALVELERVYQPFEGDAPEK